MQIECTTLTGEKKLIPKEKLFFRPAGYAIVINEGKILLCNTKTTGKYWFPGGGVNLGETIEEAIKREVMEETGIEIEVDKFIIHKEVFFYHEPTNEAFQNFSFYYFCKPITTQLMSDDDVDPMEESDKPRWIDLKSIKEEEMQTGAEGLLSILQKNFL